MARNTTITVTDNPIIGLQTTGVEYVPYSG